MRRAQDASGEYYCVEEAGYTGGVVVQEVGGGAFSGVPLFNPSLVPAYATVGPGDLVDVHGEYVEFCLWGGDNVATSYCEADNSFRLTQLSSASVTKVGETAPPIPLDVAVADLRNPQLLEQLEGSLVRVSEEITITPCAQVDGSGRPNCCAGDYDRYGNLATSALSLMNEFFSVPAGTTCLSRVTGVVSWFGHGCPANDSECESWGDYTISPRGPDDIEVPPRCSPQS
jgi:hypothetical protein